MNFLDLKSLEQLNNFLETENAVFVYFSHRQCNLCKVLKPKVAEMIENRFPKMTLCYADTVNSPEIAGQYSVFAVPTVIVFFGGKESFRKSRNIGVVELAEQIARPYSMIFEN